MTSLLPAKEVSENSIISDCSQHSGSFVSIFLFLCEEAIFNIIFQESCDACDGHPRSNSSDSFLKRLITGYEQWILYNDIAQKLSCILKDSQPGAVAKSEVHQKKVGGTTGTLIGLMHFQLPPEGRAVTFGAYCQQLEYLRAAATERRPELANGA